MPRRAPAAGISPGSKRTSAADPMNAANIQTTVYAGSAYRPAANPTPSTITPARSRSPAPVRAMAPYSRRPIAATTSISAPKPQGSFHRISAPITGSATTAEIRRCARLGSATGACLSGAANLLARSAEAALAAPVRLQRFVEVGLAERRPEGVGEVQLG